MIIVNKNVKAISPNIETLFGQTGAIAPFTFSVLPNGAGGTITSDGIYTAPNLNNYSAKRFVDTIQVEDSLGEIGTTTIMVLPAIGLIAHIIQEEMGLAQNQVTLYQQKFNVPNDEKIHIAAGILTQKPFGSKREYVQQPSALVEVVTNNWKCVGWVEVYSSTNLAFLRKEEIAAAINSTYSEMIQEANNFKISKMPSQITNISSSEGPSIPFRFNIAINFSFNTSKIKSVPYFDNYENSSINVDS